jgi:glycosyltransferase involved in cell wall biosynthesis
MATAVVNLKDALSNEVDLVVLNNVKTSSTARSIPARIFSHISLLSRFAWICATWRPQVVHIHTCSSFTFWRNSLDALIARLLLRKVVLHIHGAQFHKFLENLSPIQSAAAKMALMLANRIVVLGEGWKLILDAWANPEKVRIVPNGVPPKAPASPAKQGPFKIICLANYEKRKGQADLIEAVSKLRCERNIHIGLYGFESEIGQLEKLTSQAAGLGIDTNLEIPGPVSGEQKELLLSKSHCFCLPSYDEGLPISMLEAMAYGIPVVTTRVGAIPEAVVDGEEGLLFDPGNVEELRSCIDALIQDEDFASNIGLKGRERLIRDFSLNRSSRMILDIYQELI